MSDELLKCSCCDDPLTTDDNDSNLCGACADSLKAERDRLRKAAIEWHKYPDEKPTEFGRYAIHRRHNVVPRIDVRYWTGNDWRDRDDSIYDRDIAYWAYLPAPPKEVEK